MCLFVGLFRGRSLSKGSMNMKELHLCQPNSDPRTVILVLSSCLWPSNCLLINLSRCFFVRAALTQQLSFFDPAAASLKIKIHFLGNFVSRIRPECWQVKSLAEIHKCCWVLKYRDRIYIWPKRSAASKDTKSVKTVKRFGQCDAQATVDQRCLSPPLYFVPTSHIWVARPPQRLHIIQMDQQEKRSEKKKTRGNKKSDSFTKWIRILVEVAQLAFSNLNGRWFMKWNVCFDHSRDFIILGPKNQCIEVLLDWFMQRNVFSQFDFCNDIVGAISIWLAKTLEWIGGQLTWNLCRINLSKYVMAGCPEKNREAWVCCTFLGEVQKHLGNVSLRQS